MSVQNPCKWVPAAGLDSGLFPMVSRSLLACLCAVAWLTVMGALSGVAIAGQQPANPPASPADPEPGLSKGLDPGSTVDLELTRGRFLEPLPFDVQFYVQSNVAANVTQVTGRVARRRSSRQTCIDVLSTPLAAVALGRGNFLTANSTRRVELSVPALAPNRDYCFEFTLALQPDALRFQGMVADVLDTHLRALYGSEESFSNPTVFEAFRADLISGIRDVARALEIESGMDLRLTVPPDSFFSVPATAAAVAGAAPDPRPTLTERAGARVEAISLRQRIAFVQLLQAQAGKADAIQSFRQNSTAAAGALAAMRAAPTLGLVLGRLQANMAQPLVSMRLSDARVLTLSPADQDTAVAAGIPPNQSAAAVNVDNAWTPAELDGRIATLGSTITQFQTLRQVILDLASVDALRDAAGLGATVAGAANPNAVTTAQLTTLAVQVDTLRQRLEGARFALTQVQSQLRARSAAITAAAATTSAELIDVINVDGTTTANWSLRARSYVSADIGLAWSQPIDSFLFYVGANFYFGPVNKKAPLRWSDPGNFRKRFALMAGLPINPFQPSENQLTAGTTSLDGVVGNRPLILGAGLRLNDLLRVTSGTVLFRVKNPNPLIDDPKVNYAWFAAFSIDWDLKGMFTELGPASGVSPLAARRR